MCKPSDGAKNIHVKMQCEHRNAFLYLHISNTNTQYPVYFDEMQIIHKRGPLLEETAYYPFGLTMAGISSKAANSLENRLKYNGKEEQNKEFSDGSGLEWVDYGSRMYDGQIGRWGVVDAKTDKMPSITPFNYCINNPMLFIDPDGEFQITFNVPDLINLGLTTMSQIFGFANSLLAMESKLESFGKDQRNADVIRHLSKQTGLSPSEILNDISAGSGPNIRLDTRQIGTEDQDPESQTINMSIRPFIAQFLALSSHNDEEEYYQNIANVMYVYHEYTHYGDRKSNHGHTSGETVRKKHDLPLSTLPGSQQIPKPVSGDRGTDVNQVMLFGTIYTNGSVIFNGRGLPPKRLSNDADIDPAMKLHIKNSSRFGPYLP